jgi:hypothetical protein
VGAADAANVATIPRTSSGAGTTGLPGGPKVPPIAADGPWRSALVVLQPDLAKRALKEVVVMAGTGTPPSYCYAVPWALPENEVEATGMTIDLAQAACTIDDQAHCPPAARGRCRRSLPTVAATSGA